MQRALFLAMLPLVALAGCGKGGSAGNDSAAAPAAPAAAAKPPTGQQWTDVVVTTPDFGVRMGNPDAPIKLVEYGSRTCPHCARFDADGLPKLKSDYIASGKLSYEFRDYPVHQSLDVAPILLGHCVPTSMFFPLLDQMMANQDKLVYGKSQAEMEALNKELQGKPNQQVTTLLADRLGYLDFVKQRGLSDAKARACLADQGLLGQLAKSTETANQTYNVTGTPTFLINNKVVPNVVEWSQLEPVLKQAGA